jgi:small-conductance mechanosensitive channel
VAGVWWLSHGSSFIEILGTDARHVLTLPLFSLGKLAVTPMFLCKALLFLILLNALANKLRRLLYRRVLKNTAIGNQHTYRLARLISLAVYAVGLMMGLEIAGVSFNTLTILGGSLGIGVGFGLQSLVANWVAGIVLLIEQPVRIGDRIDVGNTSGVVVLMCPIPILRPTRSRTGRPRSQSVQPSIWSVRIIRAVRTRLDFSDTAGPRSS